MDAQTFAPTGAGYFCANTVQAFDKITILFNSTSRPYRFARVEQILFGVLREFGPDEFAQINLLQEIDLISSEVPIGALDWTLKSKADVGYIFQTKQPIEAFNGSQLIGIFYITGSKRVSDRTYKIRCQDALGVLDGYDFDAAMYDGYDAVALLHDIAGVEFPLEIDSGFTGKTVSGLIDKCTRREAFQQVLFAIGAVCTTAGVRGIKVFPVPSVSPREIADDRVYSGGAVDTEAVVTAVRVTAHSYTEGSGSSGDDVVDAGGVKYVHTTTVVTVANPYVTATDKQNVVSVEGCLLVNPNNVNAVAARVIDYYLRRDTSYERIVVDGEAPGDYVEYSTPWGAPLIGNIIEMSTVLSGTTAADIKVKAIG